MSKEDLARISKRTAEVIAIFGKNYVSALVSAKIKQSIDASLAAVIAEIKGALPAKPDNKLPDIPKVADDPGLTNVSVVGSFWRFDWTDYEWITNYEIVGAYVQAGASRLRSVHHRYKHLHRMSEDIAKDSKEQKVVLPKVEFPGKKVFGNRESAFIAKREKDLDAWFKAIAASDVPSKVPRFLQSLDLKADPEGDLRKKLFVAAFNKTSDECNVWCWEDPEEFDNEGDALQVLIVRLCRREIFYEIESKLWQGSMPEPLKRAAVNAFRKAGAKAVGAGVQAGWQAVAGAFSEAKTFLEQKMDAMQADLNAVIGQIVGQVVKPIAEKLPKSDDKDNKDDKDAKDAKEEAGWPGLDKLAFTSKLLNAVKSKPASVEDFKDFIANFDKEFTLKTKLSRKARGYIRAFGNNVDYWLSWTMQRLVDAVEGVVDLFQSQLKQTMDAMVPFFAARDNIEEVLAKIASSGKAPDACAAEAAPEIKQMVAKLEDSLRETAAKMGRRMGYNRSELRWSLRELSSKASGGLMKLVGSIPESALNMLAAFRLNFAGALPGVFAPGASADQVRANVRRVFLEQSSRHFDPFFMHLWHNLSVQTGIACKQTAVDKLKDVVRPVIEMALKALDKVIPAALSNILNLNSMVDTITEQLLMAGAEKVFIKYSKQLEAYVFAPEEKGTPEDEAAEKAKAQAEAEAREKKNKEEAEALPALPK